MKIMRPEKLRDEILSSQEIFIVNKTGNVMQRYEATSDIKSIQEGVIKYFNLWENVKNVFEFSVRINCEEYNKSLTKSMNDYIGKMLVIFKFETKSLWCKKDEQYLSLVELAVKYKDYGLKVLVFLFNISNKSEDPEISNDIKSKDLNTLDKQNLISIKDMKKVFDVFDVDLSTNELWIYMKNKILDDSEDNDTREYTKFIIDTEGNVTNRYSCEKSIEEETLQKYLNIPDTITHVE